MARLFLQFSTFTLQIGQRCSNIDFRLPAYTQTAECFYHIFTVGGDISQAHLLYQHVTLEIFGT